MSAPTSDEQAHVDNASPAKDDLEHVQDGDSSAGEIIADTARVIDHKAEMRLCRKFDIRILPFLAIMYLFNALDKSNLGNAKTAGLDTGMILPAGSWPAR